MAYVKVKWRKDTPKNRELSASEYEKYLLKDRGSELIVDCNNCLKGQAVDNFIYVQSRHGKYEKRAGMSKNVAFEVIQSFSSSESKFLQPLDINLMGTKLAKKYFPDHQFMVVTHSDTEKLHNHILVNPINEKTGQRDVKDKKKHLYNLRSISDEIVQERGLSIIKESERDKEKKLPQQVVEMNRRGARSRRMDLFQKADMARGYATSFDEYVATLDMLQVQVAITDKNITYFYGGNQKGTRGKKLGRDYDKKGLISQFKVNDEKFDKMPNLKRKAKEQIREVSGSKNYGAYTKSNRRGDRTPVASSSALIGSMIPMEDLKDARSRDIFAYCKKHNVKTKMNDKGDIVLKGRENIVLTGTTWKNTRNNTAGSLIEFVAFKDDITFLAAVSKISGNSKLARFEKAHGEVKRPYKSFYIPKEKEADVQFATKKVASFLKFAGINSEVSKDLFRLKKVQVDKKGSIWLFPENGNKGAIELSGTEKKGFSKTNHGTFNSLFASSQSSSRKVTVYSGPFSYMKVKGKGSFGDNKRSSDIVLMGLDESGLDQFLSKNKHVKNLCFVLSDDKNESKDILSFVNKVSKKHQKHSMTVGTISFDSIEKKHRRGLELDF